MFRYLMRLSTILLLCLVALDSRALTGPQTAQLLNQRMSATPAQCVGGNPPYACSGVLLRPMSEGHPQPFWHHDSEAEARGSELFQFLRKDGGGAEPGKVGYILQDRFSAVGQGKPYETVDDGTGAPGEVMVRNWAEDAPEKLAVQALYYDKSDFISLLRALHGQLQYFQATGTWLPLVRFAAHEGHGVFGFSQQEQLYNGFQIAARLNARYADTRMACPDGKAAYYCNGVILRAVGPGDFHAWNPSPNAIRLNGVSFSYFRSDMNADTLVYPRGYAIRELSAPAVTPFEPTCVYPADGATGNGEDGAVCTLRDTCQALGVKDLAGWRALYEAQPRKSCAFSTSVADLQLMLDIRQQVADLDPWNEIVMVTWPQDIGHELPIEAIVYSLESVHGGDGLGGGQHTQRDYLEQTGRYLPLLKTDLAAPDGKPFTFAPADQVLP